MARFIIKNKQDSMELIGRDLAVFEGFLKDIQDLNTFESIQKLTKIHKASAKKCKPSRFHPFKLTEQQFRAKYKFAKDNARKIIEMVRDDLEAEADYNQVRYNQVPLDLQIMAALRCWGLTEHPEMTAAVHGVKRRTLDKICRRVASALASKASRYIRMPAAYAEKERVTTGFQALASLPQVIGAVICFDVRLKPNTSIDNKGNAVYVQVVCDSSLKIRDLDCRSLCLREDSYDPNVIFSQTRIKERFEQNEFRGRVLLGDHRLFCSSFLYTPVRNPNKEEELAFNESHKKTYAPALNCLSLWSRRFGILSSEMSLSSSAAKQTIVALALLHNMAVEWIDPCMSILINTDDKCLNLPYAGFGRTSLPFDNNSICEDVNPRSEFIKATFSKV